MRWWQFWQRARRARQFRDELESYLEHETEERIAAGLSPEQARLAAHRKLGNLTRLREDAYERDAFTLAESIWQDLRLGFRQLFLNPGFTCAALLSLSLGMGANTAIFQLLDAVRLRSLPVERPEQLAVIQIAGGNRGMGLNPGHYGGLTRPIWEQIRREHPPFSGVFAWEQSWGGVGRGSTAQGVRLLRVSGELFPVLGVQPVRGRLIGPPDETACPASVVVVSYGYWQRALGARELDGLTPILINGDWSAQVIGVTPPDFFGLAVGENFDIAVPYCRSAQVRNDVFGVTVMGRLNHGWTIERATKQLESASRGIFEATAITGYSADTIERYKQFRLEASAGSSGVSWLRSSYDASLQLLLAITGLVLLIACANLANLMLVRGGAREREIAVRLALGASRGRVLRQLTAESLLLAVVGGVLGVLIARLLSRVLVQAISTESAAVTLPIATDWRVLLFAGGVASLTCVLFGLVPALRTSQAQPISAMKADGRSLTTSRARFLTQRVLVVIQIAVSLVLLVGALLFVRSFANLATFDAGVRQDGIIVAAISAPLLNVPPERLEAFHRQLLEDVQSVPGILSAATTSNVPLLGSSWTHAVQVGAIEDSSKFTWVSSDYFRTMGMSLLDGRGFDERDTRSSQRVAIVNETFVGRFLNGADPKGRTLTTVAEPNFPATAYEIVGVVADTKYNSLRGDTPPMAFAPGAQYPNLGPGAAFVIHTGLPSGAAIDGIKRTINSKYPDAAIQLSVFRTQIQDGMVRERLMAMLSGFFGLLAALLSALGLYGMMAYLVARRRTEIGIRLALGARPGQVLSVVMHEAARLLLVGLPVGAAISLAAARSTGSLLFGVTPHDPATLAGGCVLLTIIAVLASLFPARRAAQMDPMDALRQN